ncbi:hypothetical protein, partial [Paraburkholderia tagetis]|uniref:hypothetical protein n=1 Tax=Paraburkholderia tagetis TaxID=2913261 RepID=UPI003B75C623
MLTLDRTLEELLPYVLYLLGMEEQESALLAMDPQIRRERTFDAITRLLEGDPLRRTVLRLGFTLGCVLQSVLPRGLSTGGRRVGYHDH